jgi:galactose mutarotase-like enzyme
MSNVNTDIYELNDECSISIAPNWGCNLFSWRVRGSELMYCPEDVPAKATKITGGGNPTLFPSVGRTWDHSSGEPVRGNYRIHGFDKSFFMPSHGIVFMSDFSKVNEERADDAITVSYQLGIPQTVHDENYPFNLGLIQRFTLRPESVELEATITNNGDVPAPCAFGYHPYFRISNSQREGVQVRLPVQKRLLLTPKTVMLTGETQPTDGIVDLKAGIYYDSAYGEPVGVRMTLIDSKVGRSIHVDFDEKCELFFLYSPDDSEFVCIEPWSRGLGAYEHLKEPGWEDGSLIPIINPGEQVNYRAFFSISQA